MSDEKKQDKSCNNLKDVFLDANNQDNQELNIYPSVLNVDCNVELRFDNLEMPINDDRNKKEDEYKNPLSYSINVENNIGQNTLNAKENEKKLKNFSKVKNMSLPKRNLGAGQKHVNELW